MANKTIDDFTPLATPDGTEQVLVDQGGGVYRTVTVAVIEASGRTITSAAANDILVWDAGTSKWVNRKQVTSAERTAGTETAIRSFAPADVKSMVDTHAPLPAAPTMQVFTSSGTWTKPAGCRAVLVEVHGGGGGGGHESSGNGTAGGTSSWSDGVNTLSASGGGGGPSGSSDVAGGAAGIGTGGTINLGGGRGGNSNTSMSTTNALEGLGGSGAMRSGPQTPSQGSGQYGVGIGGGGAGDTDGSRCGAGGGGGGYTAKMIDVTGIASATVVVGAGGTGGQSGFNGGAPGMVMVTEFY